MLGLIRIFIRVGVWFFVSIREQKKIYLQSIKPLILEYFPDIPKTKLARYKQYSLFVYTFLYFDFVKEGKISNRERLTLTYLSALSPIVDDCFEQNLHLNSDFKYWNSTQQKEESTIPLIRLTQKLTALITLSCINKEEAVKIGEQVIELQFESDRIQRNPTATIEDIKRITYQKGAISAMVYRVVLDEEISPEEKEFFNQYGYLLQWMDDFFDIYEDLKDGIRTIPMISYDLKKSIFEYQNSINELFVKFKDLPFEEKKKKIYSERMFLLLIRGFIAGIQLLELKQEKGNIPFDLTHYQRKEYITDFQKSKTILRYFTVIKKSIHKNNYFEIPLDTLDIFLGK